MDKNKHEKYMAKALELAAQAKEMTYPNPMVGAVIVKGGRIIGAGYHKKCGTDHAEVAAIKSVKGSCGGADMYVTLEPCSHYGRTPPCVKAILDSSIKNVYMAMIDPNPVTSRKGLKKLKRSGLGVYVGLLGEEAAGLNEKYIKYIRQKMPYVTVKTAQSLDGKIAARNGSSKWITSEKARKYSKRMRSRFDAVIVGSKTVIADDPVLLPCIKSKKRFMRIVVDSMLRMSREANLIKTASKDEPVLVAVTDKASAGKIKFLQAKEGVEILVLSGRDGKVSIKKLLKILAERGLVSVLVEGGAELAGVFADLKLVDEWWFYIAPKIIGGKNSAVAGKGINDISKILHLKDVEIVNMGGDILVRGKTCLRV